LQILRDEHDDLQVSLTKLAKAHSTAADDLFAQLKTSMTIHIELEHTYVYPQLRQDQAVREVALEALEEHHVIETLQFELTDLKPKDERWGPKVRVLRRIADQHIETEEQKLFPRLAESWDDDKCRHVGRSMEALRARRRKELQSAAITVPIE